MKKNYLLLLLLLITKLSFSQTTVSITADRDNTIYSAFTGNSNGLGDYFFVGKNTSNNQGSVQRALLHFDVSSLPAGAVVTSATLTVYVNKTAPNATGVELRKMNADWGEGTSDAAGNEASGAPATPNDATWDRRFFSSSSWATTGGDFSSTVSASVATISASLSASTLFSFTGSTLIADVQQWITSPAANFGWMIKSTNETVDGSVKRFISRNSAATAQRPTLSITYSVNLPVTLQQFSGSIINNKALLQWQTASEVNNKYFVIMHSRDGINFSAVDRVEGRGNSSGVNSYSYTHAAVAAGKNYYRLAQYDVDGKAHYSGTIVLAANASSSIDFYPNPTNSVLKIATAASLHAATFSITTVSGQTIKKGIVNNQQIKVDDLLPGQYWLTVIAEAGEQYKASFVKR